MPAVLAAVLLLLQAPHADSARAALDRAAKAMGGREALLSLKTVDREMRTETSDPTQGGRPARPGELDPPFYLNGTRTLFSDYARGRQRTTVDGAIYGNQPSRFLAAAGPDSVRVANLTLRTRSAFPAPPGGAAVGSGSRSGTVRRPPRREARETPTWSGG